MMQECPRCHAQYPPDRLGSCPRCLLEADSSPVVIGDSLELLEPIGRGGMGTVYKARHLRLDRLVAVKLLPESLSSDPNFRKRLEREARTLAMLNHPNIVAVHDFGHEDGQSFIVMELVEGRPLATGSPTPIPRALEILRELCEALSYAHDHGVVHRDLKPENILIDENGHVKVADFGIARIADVNRPGWTVTAADGVFGTPHYLAPEVLEGAPPDPRMDIYSLGVVLYQMVTGRLPVGDFEPLTGSLDRIVRKALAPDPARRYANVEEIRRDLAAVEVPSGGGDLDGEERNWLRTVALVEAIATAIALWAFLLSVTPKVLGANDVLPLIMLGTRRLADGRIVSPARFETWPTLAALAALVVGILAYGALRRHWKIAGLLRPRPDFPVRGSRRVLFLGVLTILVFANRKLLESRGHVWIASYEPIIGGLLEFAVLFFFWLAILEAWRTSRPLHKEPWLWLGLTLAIIPPSFELTSYVAGWRP